MTNVNMICFSFVYLSFINFVMNEELHVSANISATNENIINILASKVSLNETDQTDSTTLEDTIYGNGSEKYEDTGEYIDFSLLDPESVRELFKIAERKNFMAEVEFNKTVVRRQENWKEAYYEVPFFVSKSLDLMRQSIYATRYRLQHTKALRKRMSKDIAYSGALMYGSLMQLRIKMDNIYATMSKFNPKTVKFLWYLVLYERCLTMHVDVDSMVQRIFDTQDRLKEMLGSLQ